MSSFPAYGGEVFSRVAEYSDQQMEGDPAMKVYRLVMRRAIVGLLIDRLKASHDLEFPEGSHAIDGISNYEIEALLSLGGDPKLDELHGALTRLDNRTFGICTGCRTRIDWQLLLCDPCRRACLECENEIRSPTMDASMSKYPNLERNLFAEL
jgi:RNA polymerase-binding transcription factor DksA